MRGNTSIGAIDREWRDDTSIGAIGYEVRDDTSIGAIDGDGLENTSIASLTKTAAGGLASTAKRTAATKSA